MPLGGRESHPDLMMRIKQDCLAGVTTSRPEADDTVHRCGVPLLCLRVVSLMSFAVLFGVAL
jgi:hypothetical protein